MEWPGACVPVGFAVPWLHQRGVYCGALGLLAGQRSVFSLLIRTAVRTSEGWVYGVGSGIVFDSDAEAELDELRVKLGAL